MKALQSGTARRKLAVEQLRHHPQMVCSVAHFVVLGLISGGLALLEIGELGPSNCCITLIPSSCCGRVVSDVHGRVTSGVHRREDDRDRVQAVTALRGIGIPATSIQGGFDFDGWTQVQNARSVNWDAVANSFGAYRPSPADLALAPPCRLNFAVYTPTIQPKYFLVFSPMPCLSPSGLEPMAYRTWLPPHRRYVFIQRRPD